MNFREFVKEADEAKEASKEVTKEVTKEVIKDKSAEDAAVKDALKWLDNKYGKDTFKFKHIEGMKMNGPKTKSYDITVGDNTYQLNLRKFDSNGDGENDTVGFEVIPDREAPAEPAPEAEPEL